MHEHAFKYPFSLRSPHRTRRVNRSDGGVVRFPLKEEYGRQTRFISGLCEPMGEKEKQDKLKKDVLGHFECPDEHVDFGLLEELNDPIHKDDGKIVVGFPPPPPVELASGSSSPATYVVDPADMYGGFGYEWNEKGQRCRRDSVNRFLLLTNTVDVSFAVNRTHLVPNTFHQTFGGKTLPLRIDLNGIKL